MIIIDGKRLWRRWYIIADNHREALMTITIQRHAHVLDALLLIGISLLFFAFLGTAAAFTLDEERTLGKEIFDKLDKEQLLFKDERSNAYIGKLADRILRQSERAPFDFKFSIVRSSAVNAFATPGGYVYLNQGLITLCRNEAELAGVLAHEIAHINGRHIEENIRRSKQINLSTLAAILAGALLGGGGELTAAVTGFSTAAASTLSLKYSREQEEAADRMGFSYLVSAGYDGRAMLDFLKSMRQYEFYSNSVPSYFLTHPGTDKRIHYLDALLVTSYKNRGKKDLFGGLARIQTLLLLDGKPPNDNLSYFQKRSRENNHDVDSLYGLAVTQERLGMLEESIANFRRALDLAPNDEAILRDLGIACFKYGKPQDALEFLRRAVEMKPDDMTALLHLGKTLEALGNLPAALDVYRQIASRRPDQEEMLYALAMAYGKAKQPADSHYYFGLYFKKIGKKDTALFHFQAALKHLSATSPRGREVAGEVRALKP